MGDLESGSHPDSTFRPEAIYNPVYVERELKREEANAKLPGEWFRIEKGGTIIGHNKRDGLYVRNLASNRHLEEDLALMYGKGNEPDTFLTAEEHKEAINTAFASILKDYGRFFKPDEIQRVFPGISLDNIESYDFNRTRARFFVLSSSDFDTFLSVADGSGGPPKGWRTPVGVNLQAKKADNSKYCYNPWISAPYVISTITPEDETDIIVIRENIWGDDRGKRKRIEEPSIWSKQDLKGYIEQVKRGVVKTARHELLHTFHVGFGFNHKIMEGITAHYTGYSEEDSDPLMGLFDAGALGDLELESILVSDVTKLCIAMGIVEEDVHKALLAADPVALIHMRAVLQEALGKGFAADFMIYGFGDIGEAAETVSNYLWELNSSRNP